MQILPSNWVARPGTPSLKPGDRRHIKESSRRSLMTRSDSAKEEKKRSGDVGAATRRANSSGLKMQGRKLISRERVQLDVEVV